MTKRPSKALMCLAPCSSRSSPTTTPSTTRTTSSFATWLAAAKRWAGAAATLAFLLYFLGFTTGGGEWFAMWRSAHWTGQAPAFRILVVVLAVLVYLDQPDGSPSGKT